ncbi:MAG: response regulator transcription factor [Myxococcales bacterium]|nr:MAG: response regulator transcription factor [Myxococcales bacterium]
MSRVLVIEDEEDLQQILDYNLRQSGCEVSAAVRGKEGLRLAALQPHDLVILDLMLPDMTGTEVCKQLKADPKTRQTPVLMLTAKGEEIDRVLGFELGAEDYVTKPFSVRELMLRVQAILRRTTGPRAGEAAQGFTFGTLRVDRDAHRVWVQDAEVELTALEFRLLTTLADRRNRVQSRAVLLDDVWGIKMDVATRTVDTHVKRLREKIGVAGEYIETVRGVGYRFAESPTAGGGGETG